jgi:hypothetical protein
MSDQAIDGAILSLLSPVDGRWKKVAMVISKVADAMGKDLPEATMAINWLPDVLRLL